VGFSVHETASSAFGTTPANTSRVHLADNALLTSFALPFVVGGTLTFLNNAVAIAGCAGLPIVTGGA
jgi:hypothetical protein